MSKLFRLFRGGAAATSPASSDQAIAAGSPTDEGSDTPVVRPLPGRFYLAPEERGDLTRVFDALRAPVRTAGDLARRIAAYTAATPKAAGGTLDTEVAPRVRAFADMASLGSLRTRAVEGARSGLEVLDGDAWTFVDPTLGVWLADASGRALCLAEARLKPDALLMLSADKVWGGFPFSGLKLSYVAGAAPRQTASGATVDLRDVYHL